MRGNDAPSGNLKPGVQPREETISSQAEVFDMARAYFVGWPEGDREPPIPKAPRGRDPFVYGRSTPR